jgi:hypothetical protein
MKNGPWKLPERKASNGAPNAYPVLQIMVDGYLVTDGSNRANGRDVSFLDGKKLFLGSSNPAGEASEK